MNPWLADPDVSIYVGDVRDVLAGLPDGSVDCVITSPPYWGLRDYGTGEWDGGNPDCDHKTGRNARNDGDRNGADGFAGSRNLEGHADMGALLFRDVCGKCGARRVDQQLGLEPTPDLYVQAMVAVFREVRRVLADHGTCWVNFGDSYASGEVGRVDAPSKAPGLASTQKPRSERRIQQRTGLKPKDLVGVPWRVARALQEPYYTGRITDERDRIWLAAMIEAEGCMFIHRRPAGSSAHSRYRKSDGEEVTYTRKQDTFGAGLEVASTDRAIVERCLKIAGVGSIGEQTKGRRRTLYRWMLRSNECRDIIRELYPHMVAKQHEARLLLGCPSSGDDARKAWESLKALHQGQAACIDFQPPEGMWERGWFLRSEIIWAKCRPNPMPESVTDRPTKSHETIFLLSKRPSYWFDQEAVREPHGSPWIGRDSVVNLKANGDRNDGGAMPTTGNPSGRNVRSVWEIATQPYPEAHFATYPEELVRRCLLAGCPPGGTVLDPFLGSGTTAKVARDHGRRCVGIELNERYAELAARRLQQLSLLADGSAA